MNKENLIIPFKAKVSGARHYQAQALMVKNKVCCFLNLDIELTKIVDPDRKFAMFFQVLSISCWISLSFVLFGAGKGANVK